MELFTVVEKNENANKVLGGYYIEKKKYSNKEVSKFIEVAKHYYVKVHTETESTDFNDRYSDSWDNYIGCNTLNLVIKEDEVYGFIASGLRKHDEDFVVLTFDKPKLTLIDGSVYSSVDKTYTLHKYNLPIEALDLVQKVTVTRRFKCYKLVDGVEKFDSEGATIFYLNAFDAVIEDDKVLGVKCCDKIFLTDDLSTHNQEYVEEHTLGVIKYRYYYNIVLNKI